MQAKRIIVIAGPSAAGKSSLALKLAPEIGGEVVTADSMQVYRGMDIGTAKPAQEERQRVPHHLLDIADPDERFNAALYQREADRAIENICGRGRVPLVVGGTGLYIKALLRGLFADPSRASAGTWQERMESLNVLSEDPWKSLAQVDPQAASTIHPRDRLRARRALEVCQGTGRSILQFQKEHAFSTRRYDALVIGLTMERAVLYQRIRQRVDHMMDEGLLEESRRLLERGYSPDLPSMKGLGYRHMVAYLSGQTGLEEAVYLHKRDTMRYAKRQWTWFRHQENPVWYEAPYAFERIRKGIQEFLSRN